MLRWLCVLMLVLTCVPCFAQGKKGKNNDGYFVGEGDRFAIKVPVIAAADDLEIRELYQSIKANDEEGVAAMLKEKRAKKLEEGLTLVVLEIQPIVPGRDYSCNVCRVIKNGEAIGKYPIPAMQFRVATMKSLPKK